MRTFGTGLFYNRNVRQKGFGKGLLDKNNKNTFGEEGAHSSPWRWVWAIGPESRAFVPLTQTHCHPFGALLPSKSKNIGRFRSLKNSSWRSSQ